MTEYEPYSCKSILNYSRPDGEDPSIGTINPYTGCEHDCGYCYVRAEKYIQGQDMEKFGRTVRVKKNAPALLDALLQKIPNGLIFIGTSSDPYQPAEKEFGITRELLKIVRRYGFSVHFFTKSDLILRDADIISDIAKNNFAAVSFSIISVDKAVTSVFEPEAPSPDRRFAAMSELSGKGIRTGCGVMPILPFISDGDGLEEIVRRAKASGANYLWNSGLTLRDQQRKRYLDIIRKNFPSLEQRYETLYGGRKSPDSSYTMKLKKRISALMTKYRIHSDMGTGKIATMPKQGKFSFA
jgi:DNA repair photolyase